MNQDKHTIEMFKCVPYVAFKPSRADSHWSVNYLTTDLILFDIQPHLILHGGGGYGSKAFLDELRVILLLISTYIKTLALQLTE